MTKLRTIVLAVVAAAFGGLSLVAGCTGGHASSVGTGQSAGQMSNDADVAFAQQMIMHHRQAVAMAQVAQTRAEDPRVRRLAAQIVAEQAPQIKTMTGWLHAWGKPVPTAMPGTAMPTAPTSTRHMPAMPPHTPMMSPHMSTMTPRPDPSHLRGMYGARFDRMFLQMMIAHHENAVAVATTELSSGVNTSAKQLAQNIQATQSAQISQMRQILATSSPHHS
jgi:uncharacterized protein (DUF305 family)